MVNWDFIIYIKLNAIEFKFFLIILIVQINISKFFTIVLEKI